MPNSKYFRVATEGQTTDGRVIKREWIEQAAKNYDPKKYGARVNLEHLRGLAPDSIFRSFGDVISVESRDVEDSKKALFAQINPTDELVLMVNKNRQKVYTSVEIDPNFADSGEAYLVGLAVTDSPASLGTEMLTFAAHATANPLLSRKLNPDTVFTAATETTLEFDAETGDSLMEKIKKLLATKPTATPQAGQNFNHPVSPPELDDLRHAIVAIAASQRETLDTLTVLNTAICDLQSLTGKLSTTPDRPTPTRPTATGSGNGTADVTTDC